MEIPLHRPLQVSFQTARSSCVCSEGAELATVDTADINTFIGSRIQDFSWIGGNDLLVEGNYSWTDGTAWSYTNWRFNAPNNGNGNSEQDCVVVRTDGEWDDVACHTARNFVCQKPAAGQSGLSANTACDCQAGWTASFDTGFCYKRGEAKADYDTAKAACEADSSDLASVTSETENLVVHSVLTADGNNNNGWLGATDTTTDGTWVWDDTSTWSYENWWTTSALGTAGGTVQNCVQMRWSDTTWDDIKCTASKWFVCKK